MPSPINLNFRYFLRVGQ